MSNPFDGSQKFKEDVRNSEAAPVEAGGGAVAFKNAGFLLRLSQNNQEVGYFGRGGSEGIWAEVVEKAHAIRLEFFTYKGKQFCREVGGYYLTWSGSLAGRPVAVNSFGYASPWAIEGNHLVATDSGQKLSLYDTDSKWLYANDAYVVLEVTPEQ